MPWAECDELGNSLSRIARMYRRSPRLVLPLTRRFQTPWWASYGGARPGNSNTSLCQRPFFVACHLHSSRRDGDGSSNTKTHNSRIGNWPQREATPLADEPKPIKRSIFNELFPDADLDSPPKENATVSAREKRENQAFRESPAREVLDKEDLISWLEGQRAQAGLDYNSLPPRDYMPAMLVLWNASKSLAESDFYRVGRQGEHVHGWNGSIRKVVQLFDVNTLEPLDSYFIFFTSRAAARAYKSQADALFGPLRHATSQDLSSPMFYAPFETLFNSDPNSVGQTFTLAPPSPAPLSLKLYALPGSTEARVQPYTVEHILAAASVWSSGSAGGSAANGAASTSPSHHQYVIVSLEGGAVDTSTLRDLVHQDGQVRNLAWDLTDLKPYFARKLSESRPDSKRKPKKVLNNKSNGKAKEAQLATGLVEEQLGPTSDASDATAQSNHGGCGSDEQTKGTDTDGGSGSNASRKTERLAKSARFVLSFRDALEARRFVRSWHRREFPLSSSNSPESSSGQQTQSITFNAIMPF
ncbi:hypothetical protein ACRALDRAFT_2042958 [Sodiomyces alcalophilus JCM 7366]|uniref:uncharacterized protein n=1 Tax=Sodiomyces alcalophilus JCM 7366 TaxID=591952 RepID=UPI0039B40F26